MKITTKGQVTIPLEMRERFGLLPSMDVEFKPMKDGVKIVLVSDGVSRGEALVNHMKGRGNKKYKTDELMKMTRGED